MSDYSLTKLLNDLVAMQANSLEIINALSSATTSSSDTVEVKILDTSTGATGSLTSVTIPSFGYIKNQIQVLNDTVKNMSGIGNGTSNIRLADGSFRKILVSNLQKEASNIARLDKPTSFNKKENWFFESFLNPLLYVSFNLSNQLKYNTENVEVSRYILNLDTATKLNIFNTNFLGKSDIKFSTFSKILADNNIKYFLDKQIVPIEPRTLRYYGDFSVTDVKDETLTITTALGTTAYTKALSVKLDKLTYTDSISDYINTQQLKIGDYLVVNNTNKTTRYEIIAFDLSTRTVKLKLTEGFDSITIGTDQLSYYGVDTSDVVVDVNIGFNERSIIFLKGIDPDSKILATEFSPGVGFYSNELTITDSTGKIVSLSKYYQDQVIDFGSYLYSSVKDKTVPASFGITPDAPTLLSTNFKVFQVNEHLNSSISTDIATKQYNKSLAQSQMLTLDKSISDLRVKISTTTYSNDQLRKTDEASLNDLINKRQAQSNLYSSLVDEINALTNSQSATYFDPIFRVRGFFPFPTPKSSDRTGNQEVVQFLIQYRYIGKDGSANKPQQIEYVDTDGQTRRGTFSNWVEYQTPLRNKTVDEASGNFSWSTDSTENADIVNINQIDIPIVPGESVQFRIKSISEAGWPATSLMSDWSEIVKVDFPTELESIQNINSIGEQAKAEKVKTDLLSEFSSMNLDKISSLSLTQNGNFYANDSKHVASGFLTPENNIVSLFDKLIDMDNQLKELRSLIENSKGNLAISIIDEMGQEYKIERNKTHKIFAGNYKDEVSSLQIKKGAIVTKTYLIKLVNDAASNLELYSRLYGSKVVKVESDGSTDYITERKYDQVPLGISKSYVRDASIKPIIDNLPNQSAQVKSQYLYARYKSVDGVSDLYQTGTTGEREYHPIGSSEYSSTGFVWNISNSATNKIASNDLDLTKMYVHENHPDINSWINIASSTGLTIEDVTRKFVRNSILANSVDTLSYWKQTDLSWSTDPVTAEDYFFSKICYIPSDQYLIGMQSVGAYLFLNPNSHDDIVVNGSDSLSTKLLKYGSASSITIPLVFQYRMTDYYGSGDTGIGNIGGNPNFNTSNNLEYTKRIGIDIYNNLIDKDRFSFDIEVSAKYYSSSMVNTTIPNKSFENTIEDLTNVVRTINPNLNKPNAVTGRLGID